MEDKNRKEWNLKVANYIMTRMNIDLSAAKSYAQSLNNAYKEGLSPIDAFEKDWENT